MLFESDHNLSDLDNDDYGKLNSSSNKVVVIFFVGKCRQKIHPWTVMLWNRGQGAYFYDYNILNWRHINL